MNISLDYDNTYTADQELWRAFIQFAQLNGHTVYIVTMRSKENDWDKEFDFLKAAYKVDAIFCDGRPKRDVCNERGIEIAIWIDDMPEGISQGTHYTPEELEQWRENGREAFEEATK